MVGEPSDGRGTTDYKEKTHKSRNTSQELRENRFGLFPLRRSMDGSAGFFILMQERAIRCVWLKSTNPKFCPHGRRTPAGRTVWSREILT